MTLVWGGLSLGAVYAIIAIGYNIVFIASGVFNFAHAQLIMMGTFLAYEGLAILKIPVVLIFFFGAVSVGILALLEDRIAIRPIKGTEGQLVTTVGVATLLNGITQLIWGGEPLAVPFLNGKVLTIFGGRVEPVELTLIIVAVGLTLAALLYARVSLVGLALLAIAENREAAALRGVNVGAMAMGAFTASGVLAGALGPVIGPKTFAVATLGSALALKGFVALALGGFGSLTGGLIGGLVIGLVEEYTTRYLGSEYANMVVLGVLLVVLMTRPTGLFGRTRERVV